MRTWKRYLIWLGAAATGLALTALPAAAIIGGTQDTGNIFSNTGLIVVGSTHWCSGALYRTNHKATSSVLFMTAAHCVLGYDYTGAKVTFDPAGDSNPHAQYIPVVAKYSIPSFSYAAKGSNSLQNGNSVPDVAVLVLDHAPAGITPADLPTVGLVDSLDFKTAMVTAVGYGTTTATSKTYTYGARYYKDATITPGQRAQSGDLYLKTEASTCFGDSGGPDFLGGTNTILGDTSWGQSVVCSDHNYIYRVDNAEALNFLNNPTTGVPN